MRRGQGLFLIPALLLALSCGRDLERTSGRVRVLSPGGRFVGFTAIVASGDRIASLHCPRAGIDQTEGGLTCTDDGFLIANPAAEVTITVKARGWRHETRVVGRAELAGQGLAWPIELLAAPEHTWDYATGFSVGECASRFEALSYPAATELGQARVVKFYIDDPAGTPTVYFQDTRRHPIHYDFVRDVLGKRLTQAEFYAQTYRGPDRPAMAGTILHYPDLTTTTGFLGATSAPFVVTFFPSDNLTPRQARLARRLIEERLGCAEFSGGESRVLYLPAGAVQEADAAADARAFAVQDAAWLVRAELYGNLTHQLLNPGVAYGTLRLLTPEQLENGIVSFTDILVLTRLPNELPVVGGTITEELQTPLAHVNVAARNRGTPNMALVGASADERVAPFLGRLVRFEVTASGFTLADTTLAEAEAFWASRHGDPVVPAYDLSMDGLPRFSELAFSDSLGVGVKAANLAELHRILPDDTSDGFAVPFRHYHEFTLAAVVDAPRCEGAHAACLGSGRAPDACDEAGDLCLSLAIAPLSLHDFIRALLADPGFRADARLRDAALDGLRFLFEASPVDPGFGAALDARVAELFGTAKVKLRSSTNTEDLPDFSGAGLYSSHGAWASGDKAASRVIRRTWASVWNREAFEERAFWNIDHLAVQMGVAVNVAFVSEAANGVLVTQNLADPTVEGMYVNVQLGEFSVTNPEGGILPEIFLIVRNPEGGVQVCTLRYSSLSPDRSILSFEEVGTLHRLSRTAHEHFAGLYGRDPGVFALDLEFKLWGSPRRVYLKQARPYVLAGEKKK